MPPTPRQQEILDYLCDERDAGRPVPTYREIAGRFGFSSPKAATDHVRALERHGCVRRHTGKARGIEVVHTVSPVRTGIASVPLLGEVAAGAPSDQTEQRDAALPISRSWLGGSASARLFAVRVRGESMVGRCICDGDLAIAEADATPAPGDVVVALVDSESTLKTLGKRDGQAFLRAANPLYPDPVPVSELVVQGVVRAIVRRLS